MSNIMEGGKVFKLAESVDYTDGAVVSKAIVKKSTGNITLFAFDEGEGLSEHSSPYDALVQLLDGTADITIGGNVHRLQAGENIILPASIPHSLKAAGRFKMMLTMIKG
jgi:quercetin dioxygenase-like cupin family protein